MDLIPDRPPPEPPTPPSRGPVARRWRLTGWIVLGVGLLCALLIYFNVGGMAGGDGYQVVGGQVYANSFANSVREQQQLERLGGKVAVLTYRFHLWLLSLWQGPQLGITVAILTVLGALLCFKVARLVEED